jgi:hypothetical protein
MIPFSRTQFIATRQGLLDRGDTIVPGHGPLFHPKKEGLTPILRKT